MLRRFSFGGPFCDRAGPLRLRFIELRGCASFPYPRQAHAGGIEIGALSQIREGPADWLMSKAVGLGCPDAPSIEPDALFTGRAFEREVPVRSMESGHNVFLDIGPMRFFSSTVLPPAFSCTLLGRTNDSCPPQGTFHSFSAHGRRPCA